MNRHRYHHGNLRNALIEAAIGLIETKGTNGFTLSEASRLAGVSAAAPYRHFAGREDLMREVARLGFQKLGSQLRQAFDEGRPDPLTAIVAIGTCYVDFADENPGYYGAMFESGLVLDGTDDLSRVVRDTQNILVGSARLLLPETAPDRDELAARIANDVWALSHGVIALFGGHERGSWQAGADPPRPAKQLLIDAGLTYLRGLGVVSP